MKRGLVLLVLVLCLLLSGCMSWMDGSYSSVNLHTQRQTQADDQAIEVSTYQALCRALSEIVEGETEKALVNVSKLDQSRVQEYMERAIDYVMGTNPIGAYAVEGIAYELGTSGGQPAVAVTVTYNSNKAEIRRISRASGMDEAKTFITEALDQCESDVVVWITNYGDMDFIQFVEDYADENPWLVMEVPQLTVSTYPETGSSRVLEISFTYQNSREALRNMQSQVRRLFTSAEYYVSGNDAAHEKYSQLYTFLMERHEYTVETSITPSYSLLVHGVGDSKAFATVFSGMCRRAGLECLVVSGTSSAEPLFWNIVCVDGVYYHVDLLSCSAAGHFRILTDDEMGGYVWDYSAYPACVEPETTVATEDTTEPAGE